MKLKSQQIKQLGLLTVVSLIAGAEALAQLPVTSYTQNNDDLVLGFTIPPSTADLVIDLGTVTQVGVAGTNVVDLNAHGNVGKSAAALLGQLNSLYGSMDSLTWGVVGGQFSRNSAVYCTVPHGAQPPTLGAAGNLTSAIDTVGLTIDGSGSPPNQQTTDPTAGFGTSWTENIASPSSLWQVNGSNPDSTTSSSFATGGIKYQLADLYVKNYTPTGAFSPVYKGYLTLGNDGSLTFTPATAAAISPTAITQPASSITAAAAALNASVNPNGAATTFSFQYGTNSSYGTSTPLMTIASGTTAVATNATISGLLAGTTYHFRVVATNNAGSAAGSDLTFTTLSAVTPPQLGGLTYGPNGFAFSFASTPGLSFTAWGTTNLALPFSQWSNLGPVIVIAPGQYQFTDPRATNGLQQFYRVTQP